MPETINRFGITTLPDEQKGGHNAIIQGGFVGMEPLTVEMDEQNRLFCYARYDPTADNVDLPIAVRGLGEPLSGKEDQCFGAVEVTQTENRFAPSASLFHIFTVKKTTSRSK